MRDLDPPSRVTATAARPKGIAFEIADLLRIRAWATVHDRHTQVRLDHGADGEEYEEVIEFRTGPHARSKTIMWRSAHAVFVQPLPGKRQRYRSVHEALAGMLTRSRVVVSDIVATAWPPN